MTVFAAGLAMLGVTLLLAGLAIFSGHIPVLCRILGGAPLEKEPYTSKKPEVVPELTHSAKRD